MTQEEQSAIIGYYRQGANIAQISQLMEIPEDLAKKIIDQYLKSINYG